MSIARSVAPRLETERLVLRGHTAGDLDSGFALWGDPAVVKHISGKPATRQEAWWRILRYAGHWALMGYGYWAVEERATGRFVGDVGFADFKRDIDPPLGPDPEAGWVLSPSMHGNGYATEAVGAALEWLERNVRASSAVCMIAPENLASLRVAAKCGFGEQDRRVYLDSDVVVMRRVIRHP